jgi:hypothetical protein
MTFRTNLHDRRLQEHHSNQLRNEALKKNPVSEGRWVALLYCSPRNESHATNLSIQRPSRVRAGAELLGAFFLIGFTGLLPAGVLYRLMRPTIVVNPGLSAYQAPRADPLLPRIATRALNSHALPFVAASSRPSGNLMVGRRLRRRKKVHSRRPALMSERRSVRLERRHTRADLHLRPATPLCRRLWLSELVSMSEWLFGSSH